MQKASYAAFILQLIVLTGLCQTNPAFLIKANTGKPVEYMRQVRTIYKLNKNKPIEYEKRYSFERRGVETTEPATGRFNKQVVTIKPELKITDVLHPTASVQTKMNSEMTGAVGPDPMVAVGEKTILVGNTTWIKFFDKSTGNVLEEIDVESLFWRFLSPTIPGTGQPNPEYATNFYDVPNDIPLACSKSKPCGVDDCPEGGYDNDDLPCGETDAIVEGAGRIETGYDLRVLYQKEHKRFVLVAAMRNQTSPHNDCYNIDGKIDCSKYAIRLVAIAVSVSENPADGFHIYRTTENNVRDWPSAAVDEDYIVIANRGSTNTNGKSIVTVCSFTQMKDGVGPSVNAFRIKQNDQANTPQAVIPVQNLLTNQYSRAFFFIEDAGSCKIRIWYFKKPSSPAAIFQNPPTKLTAAGEISIEKTRFTGGAFAGATYYDKLLYTVSYQKMSDASGTKRKHFRLNVFQIPVIEQTSGDYKVSKNVNQGFQHSVFETENYSFLDPSLAVDVLKNMVIQFIRIPRDTNSTEFPTIRYKVKLSHKADWEDSRLAKKWAVEDEGNAKLVDYSWVAKDPFKLTHFWQAHLYKDKGNTGTWIGRIDLSKF